MIKKTMVLFLALILVGCAAPKKEQDKEQDYVIEKSTFDSKEIEFYKQIKADDIITLNLVINKGKYKTEEKMKVKVTKVEESNFMLSYNIKLTIISNSTDMEKLNKVDSYYISKE